MQTADLLIAPRWLLPIAPVNVAHEDHAIVVTGGRIVAVGPLAQLEARFDARERVSRRSHVLMPGLVNAHTNASACLFRGLPVYAPVLRWTREILQPIERRFASPDFVRDGTQLAIAEMLRAGVTTFADTSPFPEESARVAAAARMRAAIGLPVDHPEDSDAANATSHFDVAARLWDEYKSDPWVSLYFAPPPSYVMGDAMLARLRSVADELDARIAMPLHETEVEIQDGMREHGLRPIERLARLGLLRPGFTALQMNRITVADVDVAQDTGICVVACPQSGVRLRSGAAPVGSLFERNVPVGLGTDSPVISGAFDVLLESRMAHLLAGVCADDRGNYCGLPAGDALWSATLGGATALGLGSTCGSIEPGKAADLVCIDLAPLACQSSATIAEAVLYGSTRQHVTDVWSAGRVAVSEGHLLAFDEQELLQLARHWSTRIHTGVAE